MKECVVGKCYKIRDNKQLISVLVLFVGLLMLISSFFVPFASATGENKEWLERYPDATFLEGVDMTNKEGENISLFEFVKIYFASAKMGIHTTNSIVCLIIIFAFALFVVMTTLFSLLKKPIVILVFNILSLTAFSLLKWDFNVRGSISDNYFDWGFSQYFCYLGVIAVFIGAIALLVVKIKQKKEFEYN